MVFQQIPPLLLLVSYYLFLLLVVCPESAKIWLVMCPESAKIGRFYVSRKRVENSPESQRSVETALTGPLMAAPRAGQGEHRPESGTALLGASTGLCRHEAAFPASGVTEPEAFLARWMCVVHLFAQNEEPAQRPGCPLGSILGWVRDVGFRLCSHYGTRVSRLHRKHRRLAADPRLRNARERRYRRRGWQQNQRAGLFPPAPPLDPVLQA